MSKIPIGLDTINLNCETKYMNKLPQAKGWAVPPNGMVESIIGRFRPKKKRVSPQKAEERHFQEEVKDQFLKLKEKGLSIPVFTL